MRNIKGQALVELALLLPFLLVLFFGIVDFGRMTYTRNALINAARCGARNAALTPGLTPQAPGPLSAQTSAAATVVKKNLETFASSDFDSIYYQLSIFDASGSAVAGGAQAGNQVQVRVSWPGFPMITPFHKMMALLAQGASSDTSVTVTGQASMNYE